MNESVNDWIKRVVVSLHYPATKETSNHQLSWHWLTIKADVHILPWVHVTLCMVYIVLTFFVSIFIFRRRIGGIESQHRSSRDVITRHSYGYTSNRFVLFLNIFPSCVSKAVLFMEFWQHDQISFRVFEIRRSLIFFHFSRVIFFLTDLLKQDIHTILSIDISNDIEIFFLL